MRRTLVQFDEPTYQKLRHEAFRQTRSVSSLVRELVAKGLDGGKPRGTGTRVARLSSIAAGRSKQGRLSPVSENHDQALWSAFEQ